MHRSAFSGSRLDAGRHELLTALRPYRRELGLVAEAPGGTFGAYCLGWYDDRNRVGEFEPVGYTRTRWYRQPARQSPTAPSPVPGVRRSQGPMAL